jgi:hypothetical protein
MLIDLTDNTRRIRGMHSGQPMSYLRNAGLAGVGDYQIDRTSGGVDGLGDYQIDRTSGGVDGLGDGLTLPDTDTITKMNSEAVFLLNLQRTASGQAPLPVSSSAPTVNVGLSNESKALVLGVGAVLAIMLFGGRKRR